MNEEPETIVDVEIDINTNAPFGSKKNRKAARERMADRLVMINFNSDISKQCNYYLSMFGIT